jgi:membrane protease YdiL (CAAX protease family)
VVNAASGSLPLVAGAVVGGAVWGGLAGWSGGIVASLASHGVWTALMLARPPASGRAEVTPG